MEKTQNYNLNQWEAADPIRREDFNADNAAIDAALSGKAEKSAVTAVETALANYKTSNDAAVAKKAEQTALSALSTNVTALSTALGSGGANCRIATGSYVGGGTYGVDAPNTLTFPFKPLWVIVARVSIEGISTPTKMNSCMLVNPLRGGSATNGSELRVTWTDTSVSWYCKTADNEGLDQNNDSGTTYVWVAVGVG